MTISLLPDLMGGREKLQLALSDCRGDTGCIEMSVEFDGRSVAKAPEIDFWRLSGPFSGLAGPHHPAAPNHGIALCPDQQKAPDRSGAF
jgi:hypothetical protein